MKNYKMKSLSTGISVFIFGSILAWNMQAGQLTISSPPSNPATPKAGDVYQSAISKWKAENEGVTFSAKATPKQGSVVGYLWTFSPGTFMGNTSAPQNGPGPVKYPSTAYGNHNPATVGVKHTVPDPNNPDDRSKDTVCQDTSATVATVNVNVVKPTLVFNTSGSFSSDDSAAKQASKDFNYNFQIGVKAEYNSGGIKQVGCPYEYIYTIDAPGDSGALSGDMMIYETASYTIAYYKHGVKDSGGTYPLNPIIYPGKYYASYITPASPSNPKMYAWDAPGFAENEVQQNMKDDQCDSYSYSITLTSYPLFQDSKGQHLDNTTVQSHTFSINCTSSNGNGSGPYTYTVQY